MKDVYIYPAILSYTNDDNDEDIEVEFPNLNGAFTSGATPKEAHYRAKNYLESLLNEMEIRGVNIPAPSKKSDIKLKDNQAIEMIKVNMKIFKDNIHHGTL